MARNWIRRAGDHRALPGSHQGLDDLFTGGSGSDTFNGTAGDDTFDLTSGGSDTANGLGGNDTFSMGATLDPTDRIDGGTGIDTVLLNGDYAGLVLQAATIVNVESIVLAAGHNYNITTDEGTVASGATLQVDAHALGAGNSLVFSDAAETNGRYNIFAGAGDDVITTGAFGDTVNATAGGNDTIHLHGSGSATFAAAFTAADSVVGDNNFEDVDLQGNYAAGLTLGATTLQHVTFLVLQPGAGLGQSFSYNITTNDANVDAGHTLQLVANTLAAGENVRFEGSAETNGQFAMFTGLGNDTLLGGAGNDFFKPRAGDDYVDGGGGKNRVTYSDAPAGVTVSLLQQGHAQATGDGNDTLVNITDVSGCAGNDVLTGDSNGNWFWGEGGSDTITGNGGDDVIQVGADATGTIGTDVADGGTGIDTLSFDDNELGSAPVVFSLLLQGTQQATGTDNLTATGFENVSGSTANDTLTGDTHDNIVAGGAGADTLAGGGGNDSLYGDKIYAGSTDPTEGPAGLIDASASGDDVLRGGAGNDLLDGGAGVNTADYSDATSGVKVNLTLSIEQNVGGGDGRDTLLHIRNLIGSGFKDTLTGDTNDNRFDAGAGNDLIHTGGGNDTVNGGDGNDTVFYEGAGSLLFSGGAGSDTLDAHTVAFDTAWLLGDDDEGFIGGSGNDSVAVLTPSAVVARSFSGGDGNDTLTGGAGNDKLDGGNGDDRLDIGAGGGDTVTGGGGNDTIVALATAALSSADHIDGGGGSDVLLLTGDYGAGISFGSDTLLHVETIVLGGGFDYKLSASDATVAAGFSLIVDGSALGAGDNIIFNGSHELDGVFTMTAGAGDDSLTGGSGADSFDITRGGTDTIAAGAGNDAITAGASLTSADRLNGGDGADTLSLAGNYAGGVVFANATVVNVETITLASHFSYSLTTADNTVAAGQMLTVSGASLTATDTLSFNGGFESDGRFALTGGAGNDVLTGGIGTDSIAGGAGNDTIRGGVGADQVTGGAGSDTYVYGSVDDSKSGTGYDTISGFDTTVDRFDLPFAPAAIDTKVATGAMSAASFDTDLAASVTAARLGLHHAVLFTPDSGTLAGHTFLVVDANGTAGYQADVDYVIELVTPSHLSSLSVGDFV